MKDPKNEKNQFRRYLDDVYTQDDASQVFKDFCNTECNEVIEDLASEVWEESLDCRPATTLECKEYKKQAQDLLKHIAHRKRTLFRRATVVAASIAAIVCIAFGGISYFENMVKPVVNFIEVTTSFGEKKEVTLPDGTLIVLNSCSQIRYPDHFINNTRQIELKGEGFFRVARNEAKPFIVKTDHFDVKVLGTHFDVKAYPTDEIVSVSVESGKVQVDLPEAMMRLTASEQVLINTISNEYSKRKEERDVAVWIKGELRFNSTPIRDVAKELERVYNCKITFTPNREFTNLISGEHDNKSLESVLQSIEYVSGVKYKKDGRNILLYK